jgi:DNA-binding CsgD family transcriptional regulator/PAS domain-containing protein
MADGAVLERIVEAAACLEDEPTIVRLAASVLGRHFPRCHVKAYTVLGFPGRAVGVARQFDGADEVPEAPGCRLVMSDVLLPLVRRAAQEGRSWVEAAREGYLPGGALRAHLDRVPALGARRVKEWGFFPAALGGEVLGGAHLLLPARERDFGADERALLVSLASRLAHPLRLAALLSNAVPGLHALDHLLANRADPVFLISGTGCLLGASPAAERLIRRHPEIRQKLGRTVRSGTHSARSLVLPAAGLEIHVSPCSPRGGAAAFLAVAGARGPSTRGRFSARQVELLELLDEGLTNGEIAERMGLAPSTVKTMLERLYRLAGVSGRVGLLRWSRGSSPPTSFETCPAPAAEAERYA